MAEGNSNIHVLCTLFHDKLGFVNDMTGSLHLFSIVGIQIMFGEERNHWIAPEWQREGVSLLLLWIAVTINPRYVGAPLSTCCQGRNNSLVVTVMPIVQQKGSADCGLFAIGTAFQAVL